MNAKMTFDYGPKTISEIVSHLSRAEPQNPVHLSDRQTAIEIVLGCILSEMDKEAAERVMKKIDHVVSITVAQPIFRTSERKNSIEKDVKGMKQIAALLASTEHADE